MDSSYGFNGEVYDQKQKTKGPKLNTLKLKYVAKEVKKPPNTIVPTTNYQTEDGIETGESS
jgi:hypothetical protein